MISITSIMQTVGSYYGVTRGELRNDCRAMKFVIPRMVAMTLCRELIPGMSLEVIGLQFGGKDHTTVVHARNSIAQKVAKKPVIAGQVDELRHLIAGQVFTPRFTPSAIAEAAKPISRRVKPIRHPTDDGRGRKPEPLLYLATRAPEPVIARTVYRPVLMPSDLRQPTKAMMMGARG